MPSFRLVVGITPEVLIVLVVSGVSCDGYISVEGRAYEWLDPPPAAQSSVYVDKLPPDTLQVKPLDGVTVAVFHGADYSEEPIDPATRWKNVTETTARGLFRTGSTTSPFRFHAAIRATKEGFDPAQTIFLHDTTHYSAVIILVPASIDTVPG